MNHENLVLIEQEGHWIAKTSRGTQLALDNNQPVAAMAETLSHFVHANQLSRNAVILLETQSAYFVPLDSRVGKKSNETTIRYAAEAKLPVDAEFLVVDLLPKRDKADGLQRAVALDTNLLRNVVDALQLSKIAIRVITPESLVWLQYWSEQQKLRFPSVLLWKYNKSVEVCHFDENGQLRDWYLASESTIPERLKHLRDESVDVRMAVYLSLEESVSPSSLADWFPLANKLESRDMKRILPFAEQLGARKNRPWINLAKPPLVGREMLSQNRQSIVRLAVAASCFSLVLCGWLFIGIVKDQSVVAQADSELRSMYSKLHPGGRVPASISRRLQSEHRESVARGKMVGTNESIEAIDVLRSLVSSLQNEWAFEIDEIRIDQTKVFVQCAFINQEDAGKFVAALEQKGFDCEPPSITLRADNRFLATILGVIEKAKTK